MAQQIIVFTDKVANQLALTVSDISYDKLYILTDENTFAQCALRIKDFILDKKAHVITIPAGDANKDIESVSRVWMELSNTGATRRSLMINLGGGMITDLGGFAAASFKRGINFINVPTSLLGAVDAAVGGKTGINFNGLKNEIGAFCPAYAVIISTEFFETLDTENLLSGYAEMIKHGLISSKEIFDRLIGYDIRKRDNEYLLRLLEESVNVKREVVEEDPFEKGLRKSLNLGHTVGHAFESMCLEDNKPVLHGYAVAWGLVCELILSHRQCRFPQDILVRTAEFVRVNYGPVYFGCKDYDRLYEFMTHDKKNDSGYINFTLLKNIGEIELDQTASRKEIDIMFDIFRDLMKI